jgi:co-chaperonin GroES (HSP10)
MIMKQEEFKQLKVGDKIRIKSEEELLKYYNIKDYLIFKVYDIKDIIFDKKEEEKMEEFKVGDRVQIKDWDEMVNEFGLRDLN